MPENNEAGRCELTSRTKVSHFATKNSTTNSLASRRKNADCASLFGRIVTDIDDSKWIDKAGLDPERHRLRIYGGAWAVDAELLDALRRSGGRGVRLSLVRGQGLEAAVEAFDNHGIPFEFGDSGAQVALPERYWVRTGSEQAAGRETSVAGQRTPVPLQGGLLDGMPPVPEAAAAKGCITPPSRARRDARPLRERLAAR